MGSYLNILNKLNPKNFKKSGIKVLDLFAGCGGLALGFESAGFETLGYEKNEDACKTYNKNLYGECHNQLLTLDTVFDHADIIIGGPPCQPFSVSGKQQGLKDSRDGFPIFVKAVENLKPKLWMFENVLGMKYRNKKYLDEIIETLESLGYQISIKIMKAKFHQVPQNRERLFVVGHNGYFCFPPEIDNVFTAGDAIGDIAFTPRKNDIFLTENQNQYIAKYEKASECINPRDLYMDRPARTLTCRNLGGATADMHRIKLPDGRRKRINLKCIKRNSQVWKIRDFFSL